MIPLTAMKYYLDPTIPASGDTEFGYVIASIRPALVGTFVKLKKTVNLSGGRLQSITEDGYYVDAVPVNRPTYYGPVVGLAGAPDTVHTRFGAGRVRTHISAGILQAQQVLFSDGTRTPDIDPSTGMRAPFRAWMAAAPWALELMPVPGDTAEVVDAKVNVARLRWTELHRLAVLDGEGRERDWENDLEELRRMHDWIPEFTYGPLVNATVNLTELEDSFTVPASLQRRISAMQEAGMPVTRTADRVSRSVPVHAVFAMPSVVQKWDEISAPAAGDVRASAVQLLNSSNLEVPTYGSSWFVNGTAVPA